ncbi:VWD domain-containing protein, partial [Dolichospermum sp. ST_sed6]|nr:VWD domain-containing protein [Dolichospermum sp. ST_sed6]
MQTQSKAPLTTFVYDQLTNFANLENFYTLFNTAFGSNYDYAMAASLRSQWQNQDFSQFPQIEIRSSQEINGALGAFSRDTNRIYLAQEFISKNQSHPEIIAQVLLEEIGHWVDSRINVADAPGDEGEIFSDLVQGKVLSTEQIQQLKTIDDTATVTIDGQVIEIEQAVIARDGGEGGTSEKIALESQGLNLVNFSWENYSIPDEFQILYEGKRIAGNVGLKPGGGSGKLLVAKKNSNELDVKVTAPLEGTAWEFNVETLPIEIKIDGFLGDVVEIDIIKEFGKLGVSVKVLQEAGLDLNGFQLKSNSNNKGKVAEIDKFQDELKKGKFYFVPTTTGTPLVFGQTRNDAGIGESSLTLTNGTVEIPIKLKIQDGYEEKVTFGTEKLDLYRQEQRLSYLAFPQQSGNSLNVNGKNDGNELSWATSLFDAVVTSKEEVKIGSSFGKESQTFINASNAPQWQELNEGSISGLKIKDGNKQTEKWATNWAFEVLKSAISSSTLKKTQTFTGASLKPGGDTPWHKTHETGLDLDIDTPGYLEKYNQGQNFFKEYKKFISFDGIIPVYRPEYYVEAPGGKVIVFDSATKSYKAVDPTSTNLVVAIRGSFIYDNEFRLSSLYEDINGNGKADPSEWLIVDNPAFKHNLTDVRTLIKTFLDTSSVEKVRFNDPRTWDLDPRVGFDSGHNSHVHFDVKVPSSANNSSQRSLQSQSITSDFNIPSNSDSSNLISPLSDIALQTNSLATGLSNAIDLGILEGDLAVTGSINSANPQVYYRFTVGNPVEEDYEGSYFGTPRDLSLLLYKLNADVDVEIFQDFNQDLIQQDDEVTIYYTVPQNTAETLEFTNFDEGIYYIRLSQNNGDTNYTFNLSVPPLAVPPDNAGNTPTNAQDLGTLNGSLTRTDFIGEVDKDDYYRFNLTSVSDLSLKVNGLDQGDLTVTLGKDINNDGVIDFDETIAISDAEGNESEAININGLADGTYYVWLSRNSGNTDYNLNLSATPSVIPPDQAGSTPSTAFDIGSLSVASNFNDFVGNVDPEDFYRFTLANVSGLKIELKGLSSDADLKLAQDVNNDGVIDSDEVISTSNLEGNDAEVINISALAAGNYFVQVHQYEGDTNYNLSLTPTNAIGSDLLVTRTDSTGAVNLGDLYTYALTVTNNGPSTATNIVLTENLPSGVNFVSATTTPVSVNNGVVTASLGTLSSGESTTVNLTLGTFASGNLLSTTNVTSSEYDYNPSNNSLVSTKTVNSITSPNADLQLTQIVNNLNPGIGNQITFTLTLKNQGPGTATVIKVQDILPGGLSFVSAYADLGSYDSNTGIWTVGNMPPNASVNLSISANVNSGQSITNTAEVIAVDEGDPDSVPNNNNPNEDDQASVTVNVNRSKISFSSPTFSVNENGDYIRAVTIIRTGNIDRVDSVTITPTNGTATASNDFNSNPIIVNFDNRETSKTIRIPIENDTAVESTETVNLTLSNPSPGATLGSQQTSVLTIVDNDGSFGHSVGDPHMKTLDGIYYEFQSVGVFTLLKSTTDDFQIQARQKLWSPGASVSVNEAIAIKIGGNRFQLDLSANPLKIDGIATNLPNGQYQPIGNNNIVRSEIVRTDNTYTITYTIISENGDQIQVALNNGSYIDVFAYPASNRQGKLVGLLGNYNENTNDDFALRNGTVIGGQPNYSRIYGDYDDSWGVTQANSLFIESITTAPISPTTVITIDTLTPEQRTAAATIALNAGITDPRLLIAAILDIHLTNGDKTFIQGHTNLEKQLNINTVGKSDGDPHLKTLDGVKYDFQAAGEFTLVKSTTDDFEVQTRQEHWRGKTNISVNTAIALKLGGQQIEFYLNAPDSTIINGNSTTIANNLSYVIGQNLIAHNDNKYTVISDNGDQINISFQSDYINVSVDLANNRKGNIVGLLGNYNGNVNDEFALRDGTLIGGSISKARLYGDYGKSWSVTQPDSLFDYAPGQNTNISFSINGLTFDTLDPQVRASTEQIVRNAGITDPDILQNAIVDFVLTNGSPEFFQSYVNQQRELAPPGSSFTLVGDDVNDILGGIGVDNLSGGKGNDTYFIDNTADTITENTDEGTDKVFSIIDYTLGDNLENLTLQGTTTINGTGNELNNSITGNAAANVLTGNLGNDTLNGGAGADTMIGGLGNDSYNVDNTADTITENLNEGTDRVSSTINYTLGDNLENLTLTGTTAINGTGNELNNNITGNAAANVLTGNLGNDILNGGAGADTMIGGVGNDSYNVDNTA